MIKVEKRYVGGTMDAEVNNVIYMELYSGPKMAHDKYEKTNVARSIDRDSCSYCIQLPHDCTQDKSWTALVL
jgi:hypothetical protein